MTICADCRRVLRRPPALVIGPYSYGPVCAKRYYVRPAKAPTTDHAPRHRAVVVDAAQLALEFA